MKHTLGDFYYALTWFSSVQNRIITNPTSQKKVLFLLDTQGRFSQRPSVILSTISTGSWYSTSKQWYFSAPVTGKRSLPHRWNKGNCSFTSVKSLSSQIRTFPCSSPTKTEPLCHPSWRTPETWFPGKRRGYSRRITNGKWWQGSHPQNQRKYPSPSFHRPFLISVWS